ncbi:MAG: carbon-nitrogen hydrolase family protein [Bacillota bacterium]|nr:carbon-nitrogen hydrolase family protein [Bacillota bacterium]
MNNCTVAICQMAVTDNKESNLETAAGMISTAANAGAKLIVLPEMFNCPYEGSKFSIYAEEEATGKTVTKLISLAKQHQVYIVGGSIPERHGDKIYNTSYIFNSAGQIIGKHRKIHLFDVDLPGGLKFYESDNLAAGQDITVVESPWGKIGVAICYDVRFPELIRLMVEQGANIIIIPAAFNMTTGPAHWDALLKVRAIDNQAFIIGASPARDISASYVAYGHSQLVDPWGDIICRGSEKEDVIYGHIDFSKLTDVRAQLPLLQHRRQDVYKLITEK